MIQRRQTLYLLLISLIAMLMLVMNIPFFELSTAVNEGITAGFRQTVLIDMKGEMIGTNDLITMSAALLLAITSLIAIFLFRNRKAQLLVCSVNYLLLALLILGIYLSIDRTIDRFVLEGVASFQWGIVLPLVILILNFLASKKIRKDEALVKSLDRLR